MAVATKVPGTVYDCIPINQTSQPPIVDKVAEVLVAPLIVWDKPSCYKLVIDLT